MVSSEIKSLAVGALYKYSGVLVGACGVYSIVAANLKENMVASDSGGCTGLGGVNMAAKSRLEALGMPPDLVVTQSTHPETSFSDAFDWLELVERASLKEAK